MATPPYKVIEIRLPIKVYRALEEAENKLGIRKEDLISRAILKVLEELGVEI